MILLQMISCSIIHGEKVYIGVFVNIENKKMLRPTNRVTRIFFELRLGFQNLENIIGALHCFAPCFGEASGSYLANRRRSKLHLNLKWPGGGGNSLFHN